MKPASAVSHSPARCASFQRRILRWYDGARRQLPWRVERGYPDAYHVLLSEFMLQQTQVATVIPYFERFLAAFPTLRDLAAADLQEVLRLWQGLGYYSRARNLKAAAELICQRHAGLVPRDTAALMELPGIGRYTAGAIASLAYGTRAAIIDGNVQRVLCRVEAINGDPRDRQVAAGLWALAEALLPARRAADFNSALMELGALVCTPQSPACPGCPLAKLCVARARGIEGQIPPARAARPVPLEERWVLCLQWRGRWLLEQRPQQGRWAGLWQFPTRPAGQGLPTSAWWWKELGLEMVDLAKLGSVKHCLTHRRYHFTAWRGQVTQRPARGGSGLAWTELEEIQRYPLSRPQQRIARLLAPRATDDAGVAALAFE